jgi:hypothetical protein
MWAGVTKELAGVKFSGSIRIKGITLLINTSKNKIVRALTISLREK